MIKQYQLRMYHHLYEIQILQQQQSLNIYLIIILQQNINNEWILNIIRNTIFDDGENRKCVDSNCNNNDLDGIQCIANIKIDDLECNNNGNDGIHDIDSSKN